MKVFLEVRRSAEDKSLFNLVAQFRNLLSFFDEEVRISVQTGYPKENFASNGDYQEEYRLDAAANGIRLFHVNELGFFNGNKRKYFHLGLDKDFNIITKRVNTEIRFVPKAIHSDLTTWDKLNEEYYLRTLFAEIKKETSYENSFGYDLFCSAIYSTNFLIFYSVLSEEIDPQMVPITLTLALALSLAIHAVVLPIALALCALEHIIINPLKWVIDLMPGEHEAFIEEVKSPAITL
ncbi:MAG: hypothetical protein H0U73_01040 [Tatlockia sp.]|nr:hypothetical protein [Tatlockia sp.]